MLCPAGRYIPNQGPLRGRRQTPVPLRDRPALTSLRATLRGPLLRFLGEGTSEPHFRPLPNGTSAGSINEWRALIVRRYSAGEGPVGKTGPLRGDVGLPSGGFRHLARRSTTIPQRGSWVRTGPRRRHPTGTRNPGQGTFRLVLGVGTGTPSGGSDGRC
jgi:hypothetical protein